jgi:TPR repeat protein
MLEKGEGVGIDRSEAVRYFKLAADQADMEGQFNYSRMVELGEGSGK